MAKVDDDAEFEHGGGADWLLSQLRGDRAGGKGPARDAAASEGTESTADLFGVASPRETELPAQPITPAAPDVPDAQFVPADTMMPADAFLPTQLGSEPASEDPPGVAPASGEPEPYDSPSDRLPFWRRPAAEQAPARPADTQARPVPTEAAAVPASSPPAPAAPSDHSSAAPTADTSAPAQPAGGFQWGLTPSDEPDPVVTGSRAGAKRAAEPSGFIAPVEAFPAPEALPFALGKPDAHAGEPEVRLAPQIEEPAETAVVDLSPTEPAPFEPRSASESVNVQQPDVVAQSAPSEFFDAVAATPAHGVELPDALADAMALPDGVPGAAAFGRPPVVPLGGFDDGIDWFIDDESVELASLVEATEATEAPRVPDGSDPLDHAPAVFATVPADEQTASADFDRASPVSPGPISASAAVPASNSSGGAGGSTVPPAPGAGVPRPVLWLAGALLMVVVLVGLFFLGTRLGGGAPLAASSPSAVPSSSERLEASAAAPVAVLPDGIQPPGQYEWSQLGGGECIAPFTSAWDESFTVVDCAGPHAAQLVLRSNYGDNVGVEFPGEAAFAEQITAACTAPGVIDLAAAAPFGDVQVQGSFPVTEQQWTSGAAAYFCFASRSSGEPLTGSLVPSA